MGNAENSRFFLTKHNSCGNILCDYRSPVRVLRIPLASCKYPSSAIPFSPTTSKLFKNTNHRNSRPLNIFQTLCASPPKSSSATCLSRFLSNSSEHFRRSFTISFRFILFRTLLPPAKLHPQHFQPLPNSLPKTPRVGGAPGTRLPPRSLRHRARLTLDFGRSTVHFRRSTPATRGTRSSLATRLPEP